MNQLRSWLAWIGTGFGVAALGSLAVLRFYEWSRSAEGAFFFLVSVTPAAAVLGAFLSATAWLQGVRWAWFPCALNMVALLLFAWMRSG